jgi:hypothetical protein
MQQKRDQVPQPLEKGPAPVFLKDPLPENQGGDLNGLAFELEQVEQDNQRDPGKKPSGPWSEERHNPWVLKVLPLPRRRRQLAEAEWIK